YRSDQITRMTRRKGAGLMAAGRLQRVTLGCRRAPGLAANLVLYLDKILVTQGRQLAAGITERLEREVHLLQAAIHGMQMIKHLTDRLGHRVRHVLAHRIGIETVLFGNGLALGLLLTGGLDHHPARIADHGDTRRYRLGDHRVGADLGAGADGEWPENLRAGADDHAVFQGWVALALVPTGAAQGHAVVEGHVV